MTANCEHQIAVATFRRIAESFPQLKSVIDEAPTDTTEASMRLPAQNGLDFDVFLYLSNVDELHLSAGALWVEWFPCTRHERTQEFFDAVVGLLSGRYRILEYRRGRRPVSALLQRPEADGWATVHSWSTVSLPWPRKSSITLQNQSVA
jgi:hypothetical protein